MPAAAEARPALRPKRPTMGQNLFRGGSFIEEQQQYRPPQNEKDKAIPLEDARTAAVGSAVARSSFDPQPGAIPGRAPPTIKDSGIVHALSHRLCQPKPDDPDRLVATLFYRAQSPAHPHPHPDSDRARGLSELVPQPLPSGSAAPTVDLNKFPLEPPAPGPEPLDHLYGSYVTQICLTHFLQILDGLQYPWRRISSSHRCLDSQDHPCVVEITFSPPPNPEYLSLDELRKHESVWRFEQEWNTEVVIQRDDLWRRYKRLAVFDMDSTLIQQEVVDEIAKVAGFEKQVSAITARAMNGELDFTESLRARVALLKGTPADVFERIKPNITLTRGARELCRALKRLGYKLALLSGGFIPLAKWLQKELGLDYVFANTLSVSEDGIQLTGELSGPIVDPKRKAALLEEIASTEGVPLRQVFAVGDGANDLLMLNKAGLGVAFNAKPIVQLKSTAHLNTGNLQDILFILGLTKEEQQALVST